MMAAVADKVFWLTKKKFLATNKVMRSDGVMSTPRIYPTVGLGVYMAPVERQTNPNYSGVDRETQWNYPP